MILIKWLVYAACSSVIVAGSSAAGVIANNPNARTPSPLDAVLTFAPDTEGVGAENFNFVLYTADFADNDRRDLILDIADSPGTTQYRFAGRIVNENPRDIQGVVIELGFLTSGNFVPATPGDGLDFSLDDSGGVRSEAFGTFPVIVTQFNRLTFRGGRIVANGGWETLAFSVDVPSTGQDYQMVLRHTVQGIPEPTSMITWAPLAYLLVKRRRGSFSRA